MKWKTELIAAGLLFAFVTGYDFCRVPVLPTVPGTGDRDRGKPALDHGRNYWK